MREFIKLIESLNKVDPSQSEPEVRETIAESRKAPETNPAPVMENRKAAPKTSGRLREVMEAKVRAMESAKADLTAKLNALHDQKRIVEGRTSTLKAHPEFKLLCELMSRHGEKGPQYGSVDYFIAEAYARGLTKETGLGRDAIMKEAYADFMTSKAKPTIRPRPDVPTPEPTPEPEAETYAGRPRDQEATEESPVRNVSENLSDNPWGIEWTISEDIRDVMPITQPPEEEFAHNPAVGHFTMDDPDARREGQPLLSTVPDNQSAGLEIWRQGNVGVHQLNEKFFVCLNGSVQQNFPDPEGAIAFAEHLLSGEADIDQPKTQAPVTTDEAVLAEARYYAQLAGIGAKPKKTEATGELSELLTLAGIR